jgi:hypothetical protein
MKRLSLFFSASLAGVVLAAALPMSAALAQTDFECPNNGPSIINGVEFQTNVRPGNTYAVTAIGLDGFDPVLAVIAPDSNEALCSDDNPDASQISGFLPTTGEFDSSSLNSQVIFSNDSNDFMDITIVVSGFGGSTGDFVLLFVGMHYTEADGAGDPFRVYVEPNVIAQGTPLSTYVIGVDDSLDPKITLVDSDDNPLSDGNGDEVYCDDANSSSLCWGEGADVALQGSFLMDGSAMLVADSLDSLLILPVEDLDPSVPHEESFYAFLVSSFAQNTTGEYLLAFHVGSGDPSTLQGSSK